MNNAIPLFPLNDANGSVGLTMRDLLRQFFKYGATVSLCLITVTCLTWCGLWLQPPVYEASAKILVKTEQQGSPTFLAGITAYRDPQDPEPPDRRIETEIQLLMSRANVDAVVQKLGITKAQLIQAPLDNLLARLPLKKKAQSPAQVHDETVTLLLKALTVEPLRSKTADTTSNVFEVRFACVDQALAPRAVSALLEEYIRFGAQHNRELGESALRLVDQKKAEEGEEIKTLDDRIQELTVQHASRPEVARRDTSAAGATQPDPRNATSSSIALLRTEAVELQARVEDARQSFTDDSPQVRHLTQQLRELQQRLRTGVQANASLDAEIERLERQRTLTFDRFKELRAKSDQIELFLQLNPVVSENRLITEAPILPEKPNIKIKLILGILGPIAGLLIGLVIAGSREYFDHRLESATDVTRYLGLQVLGMVPRDRS